LLNIPIARLLFAKDFFDAWQYSSVLLISVMFNALTSFQGSIFAAVKDTKTTAKTTMISAAVNVVLCILLIPPLDALGAAIATAAAYIVMWAIRLVALKKYITMRIRFARDLAVYALLVVQVLFERLGTYGYIGQVLAVLAIVLLNKEYMGMVVAKLRSVIGGKLRHD
jgi:O-antigen/teichoic acid export membrane protein